MPAASPDLRIPAPGPRRHLGLLIPRPEADGGHAGGIGPARRPETWQAGTTVRAETGTPHRPDGPTRGHVLVGEDDDVLRALYAGMLRQGGYQVTAVASGEEVLAVVRDGDTDAVLLDKFLPGMSGLAVIAELRRDPATRTLPVLLITGDARVDERVRGLETGADDYLTKPVDLGELAARVDAQLRARRNWASAVEEALAWRVGITRRLGALAQTSVEDTARAVCDAVATASGVAAVAVLGLDAGRTFVPLATGGSAPAAPVPAATLREAMSGPWRGPGLGGLLGGIALTGEDRDRAAYTPLRRGTETLGVLALELEPGRPVDEALSAVIDFAAVAGPLLAPLLETRRSDEDRRRMIDRLISERGFEPVFQPIFDLRTEVVVGYEALTRFRDGTRPDVAFADAAAVGRGPDLEAAAAGRAVEVGAALPPGRWISVNASPALVLDAGRLHDALAGAGRPVVVEITEHERVDDYPALRAAAAALGEHVSLAVDDAGAGFASLRHILDLAPSIVKLDLNFIRHLDRDPARQAMVAGLGHFAARAGVVLVGEGIEYPAERDQLLELGVGLGQGYLMARPAPVDALLGRGGGDS